MPVGALPTYSHREHTRVRVIPSLQNESDEGKPNAASRPVHKHKRLQLQDRARNSGAPAQPSLQRTAQEALCSHSALGAA